MTAIAFTRTFMHDYPGPSHFVLRELSVPLTDRACGLFQLMAQREFPELSTAVLSSEPVAEEDMPITDSCGDIPAILHRGPNGIIEATIPIKSWDDIKAMLYELAAMRRELTEARRVLSGEEQPPREIIESIERHLKNRR